MQCITLVQINFLGVVFQGLCQQISKIFWTREYFKKLFLQYTSGRLLSYLILIWGGGSITTLLFSFNNSETVKAATLVFCNIQ